jgi:Alr-MurF fusion protein
VKIITSDLAGITNGILSGVTDLVVSELLTDSRQFSLTDGLAFFAIRGVNHDGHFFIDKLYRRGVRIFVVEVLPSDAAQLSGSSFILVRNTVEALQKVAAYKRKKFTGQVIAVTGSSGKTLVKEWLADIMGLSRSIIRSPKSYNSQIGVPLSVWKLGENFEAGIFEAGISMKGEMEKLQKVIDPDIGVITNIGDAHQENFPDLKSKALEKLKLFKNSSTIVYCSDHKIISNLIRKNKDLNSRRLIDWSFDNPGAYISVKKISAAPDKTEVKISWIDKTMELIIPFGDKASVENAITVAAVCLSIGIDPEVVRKGVAGLVSVAMRMEIKNGINGCLLIEDYYNSDPGSLGMAMDYLKAQNKRKYTLILSDFVQSGRNEKELYGEVARLISRTGIDKFIGIGKGLSGNRDLFSGNSNFYYSTDEFINGLNPSEFKNEIILLKGARIYKFEKICRFLEQQVHQTVLETNLDAIVNNLNEFRKNLNNGTKIMAMVKAFAYGAGPAEIAGLLEYHRIDYLAVAYADEGAVLREAGVTLPVMVMNPEQSAFELMIRYNLEPEIYSLSLFSTFAAVASRHGLIEYPVHIKIDSGMHRLGFLPEDIDRLINMIKVTESLKIVSVFSHLASSENPDFDEFTHKQVSVYLKAAGRIEKVTGYSFLRHILNSSGIARFPEYQFDMVRPGIGIYGAGSYKNLNLKAAGRFKTRISQVKPVPAGDYVGYGCSDVSDEDRIIAILPVGYADGFSRKLGNRNGNLYIRGKCVPVIGNVCMDMCMADVTGLNAEAGDEAEIFGEHIKVEEMAEKCETIPYEILTSIPARVKRVYYRE